MFRALSLVVVISTICVSSCDSPSRLWSFDRTIDLPGVSPLGLAQEDSKIWISDADHNQLIVIKEDGKIVSKLSGFERPMHIDEEDDKIFIPEYLSDRIKIITPDGQQGLTLKDSLDAPAGVWVESEEIAIADFYNHRILYFNGYDWSSFGSEGNGENQFYYPTDVQIVKDKIYVADAYNNRIQVIDKHGRFIRFLGWDQEMNAATGVFVSEVEVFVTDFENSRMLIFDETGQLLQIISQNLNKPTDALIIDGELYVANYKGESLSVFKK